MGNIVNLFKTNKTYKISVMRNLVIYFLRYKKLSMRSHVVFFFAGKKVKVLNRVTLIHQYSIRVYIALVQQQFFLLYYPYNIMYDK